MTIETEPVSLPPVWTVKQEACGWHASNGENSVFVSRRIVDRAEVMGMMTEMMRAAEFIGQDETPTYNFED